MADFLNHLKLLVCVHMMHVGAHAHFMAHMWRSADNLLYGVGSLPLP